MKEMTVHQRNVPGCEVGLKGADRKPVNSPLLMVTSSPAVAFQLPTDCSHNHMHAAGRGPKPKPTDLKKCANGVMGTWLTRLSDRHGMTKLALEEQSVEQLIDRLFLRLLTRKPTAAEKARQPYRASENNANSSRWQSS